jgi:hypothetical protein
VLFAPQGIYGSLRRPAAGRPSQQPPSQHPTENLEPGIESPKPQAD